MEYTKLRLHISREPQISDKCQGSADCVELEGNTVSNICLQVHYMNALLYPVSVIVFTISGCCVLCILNGDLNLKSALLLFTLLSASKPHFKKRSVIDNLTKSS